MKPKPIHDVEALAAQSTANRGLDAHSSRRLLNAIRTLAATLALGLFLFVAGFIVFALAPNDRSANDIHQAGGIVALTGGSDRIADAVELLAEGKAGRLLITGVNPVTSAERLAQETPQHKDLFSCCVDIDYVARNTVGNAIATRRWVEARGITSLIVVTSRYHMPRALIELQRAMPRVTLYPRPATPDHPYPGFSLSRSFTNLRIMALEYGKFIAAYGRSMILPKLDSDIGSDFGNPSQSTGTIRRPQLQSGQPR